MKLEDRERIEGTDITIGRRVYYREGRRKVSRKFAAEYRDDSGLQTGETLNTTSRLEGRRKALEIHARLQQGQPRPAKTKVAVDELVDEYYRMIEARGLAKKSRHKYWTDLEKLKTFCREQRLTNASRFGRDAFFRYRQWLADQEYAEKTVYSALILAKQVFKWAHQEGKLGEYRLAMAKVVKAQAKPQPCFTTEQVELIVANTTGVEKAGFATLGYAGLRIGELVALRWADVQFDRGHLGMLHVRRGGAHGRTKDKEQRFVPIHPRVRPLLEALPKDADHVFPGLTERQMLKRLKEICKEIGLANPEQYKLHSFRHHFASLCANHHVAYRKALAWLGHSSSEILDLYYHLNDADSQAAMQALAGDGLGSGKQTEASDDSDEAAIRAFAEEPGDRADHRNGEGNLRANGESKIENAAQPEHDDEVTRALDVVTERAGFEPAVRTDRTRHFQCRAFSHSATSPDNAAPPADS